MVETQVLGNQKHKKYDPECNPDQTWNGGVAEKSRREQYCRNDQSNRIPRRTDARNNSPQQHVNGNRKYKYDQLFVSLRVSELIQSDQATRCQKEPEWDENSFPYA